MKTGWILTPIISEARANEPVAKKPSLIENFMPFVFIIGIVYFLFIRPSQKTRRKQAGFTQDLKNGEEVLTAGGLLGKIDGLTEQYVTLTLSEDTKIRVLRSHISSYSKEQADKKAALIAQKPKS